MLILGIYLLVGFLIYVLFRKLKLFSDADFAFSLLFWPIITPVQLLMELGEYLERFFEGEK